MTTRFAKRSDMLLHEVAGQVLPPEAELALATLQRTLRSVTADRDDGPGSSA